MEQQLARRRLVQGVGVALAVGLAGCTGDDEDDDAETTNGDDSAEPGGDGEVTEGLVYAFGPDEIAVIDPEDGEVVTEITEGIEAESWGDPQITQDRERIFVLREDPSQVVVIDTTSHEIVGEVDIGPGPTHVYHPRDDEVWAHADDEGTFYVVDVGDLEVTEIVEAGLDAEGHGKLLYHEDLGATGYATNVTDPGAPVIDLESYERTDFIEFEADSDDGTHYKAYSPANGLAYFEFGDETVVVDVDTNDSVDRLDFSGGMYISPDDEMMGVLDGDTIRFLDVTDDASEEIGAVTVEGGPDALRYYEGADGLYAFTANTMNDQAAVIDVEDLEVVDTLDVGDIVRPEGAPFLHRSGVADGEHFVTPAEDDGFVAIVDMETREVEHVDVGEGVDTVQIVGDSGTGYTGRLR